MHRFTASQGIYGAPRIFLDLREAGETCRKHRVARLMRVNQLRALHGYRTRRWSVGKPSVLITNILKRGPERVALDTCIIRSHDRGDSPFM